MTVRDALVVQDSTRSSIDLRRAANISMTRTFRGTMFTTGTFHHVSPIAVIAYTCDISPFRVFGGERADDGVDAHSPLCGFTHWKM